MKKPLRTQVAQAVSRARTAQGLTMEQLAKASGVTSRTIARIESAQTSTTLDTLEKLHQVLDLRIIIEEQK